MDCVRVIIKKETLRVLAEAKFDGSGAKLDRPMT